MLLLITCSYLQIDRPAIAWKFMTAQIEPVVCLNDRTFVIHRENNKIGIHGIRSADGMQSVGSRCHAPHWKRFIGLGGLVIMIGVLAFICLLRNNHISDSPIHRMASCIKIIKLDSLQTVAQGLLRNVTYQCSLLSSQR